jgi:PhnB protein
MTGAVVAPRGLALYLVYRDVAGICEWLIRCLGFVETGRSTNSEGVVTNAELLAGTTVVLLERGNVRPEDYPRGVRWTGVWVDDPDACYQALAEMNVDTSLPEDEPWGVRLVRAVDPEGHIWALIKRAE